MFKKENAIENVHVLKNMNENIRRFMEIEINGPTIFCLGIKRKEYNRNKKSINENQKRFQENKSILKIWNNCIRKYQSSVILKIKAIP